MFKQIKASAGSGKTYTLTRLFLELIFKAKGHEPRQACMYDPDKDYSWPDIMAVTFTNKAATEMKERVVGAMKELALGLDTGPGSGYPADKAEKLVQTVIRHYQKLNIGTIDSLLNRLTAIFALEIGITPDFTACLDKDEIYGPVMDLMAENLARDQNLARMFEDSLTALLVGGTDGFWLVETLRGFLTRIIDFGKEHDISLATDRELMANILAAKLTAFKTHAKVLSDHLEEERIKVHATFMKYFPKVEPLNTFDIPPATNFLEKETLVEFTNKASKDKITHVEEVLFLNLKKAYQEMILYSAVLRSAYSLAPAIELAQILARDIEQSQLEKDTVILSDMAGLVRANLEQGLLPEAFCRLGSRLRYLLIDEFQDTNRAQWQAMSPLAEECLATGGGLVYVGDVKQAIHGWRGGDSTLFDEIMDDPDMCAMCAPAREPLPKNWRSCEAVVMFNNDFFHNLEQLDFAQELAEKILAKAGDEPQQDFAATLARIFTDSFQQPAKRGQKTKGYVNISKIPQDDSEEARVVALLDEIGQRRPWGDIAILVRSNREAAEACSWLIGRDIPVVTENSLTLGAHPVVSQAVSFLRFLEFPPNDFAFGEFILGRELFLDCTGLDQEELADWMLSREGSLYAAFKRDYQEIWTRHIEKFFQKSGLMTPYDLIKACMDHFQVAERMPDAELYVSRLLELAHNAEQDGASDLASFLELWDKARDLEKVPLPDTADAVRIMTIHKSKGLEFPVVIVPDHGWRLSPHERIAAVELEGNHFLTTVKSDLGDIYHRLVAKAALEQINLLYVAWTRAGQELYGFYKDKPNSKGQSAALEAVKLALDDKLDDENVFEFGELPVSTKERPMEAPSSPPLLATCVPTGEDQDRDLTAWLPRLRVYRHSLTDYSPDEMQRGEAAHLAMEYLTRTTGPDRVDQAVAQSLARFNLPPEKTKPWEAQFKAMLNWFLSEPKRESWLKGRPETEILDRDGNAHRIDLLVRAEEETLAVEFKTGGTDPEHDKQLGRYLGLLKQLPGMGRVSGVLVYLDLKKTVTREARA